MRGTSGTYTYRASTPDIDTTHLGVPSGNDYNPSDEEFYTSADGQNGTIEDFTWTSTAGGSYNGPTLRDVYQGDQRVVWYEYRLLTQDLRGLRSINNAPGSPDVFYGGQGNPPSLGGTQGAFIDKCWNSASGTLAPPPNHPDFPFYGTPVDLTPFVLSATINQDTTRPVQGTMTLLMKDDVDLNLLTVYKGTVSVAPVDYLYDAVQPIQCIRAPDGGTLRVPLGLFLITSPELGFGGPAGTRTLQCSDVLYIPSRNQTTIPPGPAYFGGATYSSIIATTSALPTQLMPGGQQYDPGTGSSGGPNYGVFMTNPCCTGNAEFGFVYLIDAIRALLTNYPDDPALPGCGLPVWWLHPQFPHAPSGIPPDYAGDNFSEWNWNQAGGHVDPQGPVMDAAMPPFPIVFQEGQTYLEIINNLLYSGGFDPLFVTDNVRGPAGTLPCLNSDGLHRTGTPVIPQLLCRPWPKDLDYHRLVPSWVYDTTQGSIVVPGSVDHWSMDDGANVITLIMEAADRTTINVWAANMNPASPISLPSLGRRLVNVIRQSNIPKDLSGSDLNYARLIALFELNKAASQYQTLQFSTAVVPFHTSGDRLAVNIQQRFYGQGNPYNVRGVVGGLKVDTGTPRFLTTLNDVFIEQSWEIQIPTQSPGSVGFPSPGGVTTDLSPLVSKGGATMSHTLRRFTRTSPQTSWDMQAGRHKWVTDIHPDAGPLTTHTP